MFASLCQLLDRCFNINLLKNCLFEKVLKEAGNGSPYFKTFDNLLNIGIRTRIDREEGEHADHPTTTSTDPLLNRAYQ